MNKPLVDRIPFAKIVTVLAVVFGIALGMCGLTAALSSRAMGGNGGALRSIQMFVISMGVLELIALLLSAAGLLVTVVAWVVLAAVGSLSRKGTEPQRLFDDSDDEKKSG